ncbi:hypothetical protein FJT64_024070 [Amphibalanus amphitrite]|uniref:Uncharacterized protein n=1 Tax=Amphibalanus amphitrite TaxID=1232801 RepID=A0A6A4WPG3_AMPAM|nr:hypothetical protein FJT64_024070 [Amphibalanus amphitrite]
MQLAASLKGPALEILGHLPEAQCRNFEKLTEALNQRFGVEHQEEAFRAQFRTRSRRPQEPLAELAQDIEKLAYLAYPLAPAEFRGILIRDQFIDALDDIELKISVRQTRPSALKDALGCALELEMDAMELLHEVMAQPAESAAELQLYDSDLEEWLGGQTAGSEGALHLLSGDSIARDAPFRVQHPDRLLRLTVGGMTWSRLPVDEHLRQWKEAASLQGLRLGVAVLWLSGNDVYSRRRGAADLPSDGHWEALHRTVERCTATLADVADRVVLLGPLPRFVHDAGRPWERTAAYHLERHISHWLREMARPDISQVELGRRLTHRVKKRHVVNSAKEFNRDGLHLTEPQLPTGRDQRPSDGASGERQPAG